MKDDPNPILSSFLSFGSLRSVLIPSMVFTTFLVIITIGDPIPSSDYNFFATFIPVVILFALLSFSQLIFLRNNKERVRYINYFFRPPVEKKIRDYYIIKNLFYVSIAILLVIVVINALEPILINPTNTKSNPAAVGKTIFSFSLKTNSNNTTNIILANITKVNFNNTKVNFNNTKVNFNNITMAFSIFLKVPNFNNFNNMMNTIVDNSIYFIYAFANNINFIVIFNKVLFYLQVFFTYVLISIIPFLIPTFFLTDLRFSFAKQCCNIAISKKDDIEKAKYILYSLNWYNHYIKKSLNLQLKDKNELFDNVIRKLNENCDLTEDIINALNKNKLELLKFLSDKINSEYNIIDKGNTKGPLLTGFTIADNIKGLINLIIPIITIAISVFGLFLRK